MEDYINKTWARLKTLGFKIDEEVGASVVLAGLPNEYKTMIIGLEQVKDNLTIEGQLRMKVNPQMLSFQRVKRDSRRLSVLTVEDHISRRTAIKRRRGTRLMKRKYNVPR